MGDAFDVVVGALRDVGGVVAANGDKATAQCPSHDDGRASLSIGPRRDGDGVVLYCHAGCDYADVLAALGLSPSDLFDEPKMRQAFNGTRDYKYPGGRIAHRRRDKNGKKMFYQSGNKADTSLYGQGRIAAGDVIFIPEGEKDCDAINAAGGVAVCSAMGAANADKADWTAVYGHDVVICADNDDAGGRYAATVADLLADHVTSLRVVTAKVGNDVADHIAAGYGLDELIAIEFGSEEPEVVHGGHLGMAHKLATQFAGQLLYVEKVGWHRWDGTRWAPGAACYARRAVHTVIARDRALILAMDLPAEERDKLLARVARYETANAISGFLTEAAVLQQVWAEVDALDADPWLLNCANGTLDLHTLELRPHDPADRITKVAAAGYLPGETGTMWPAFLEKVLPDDDVREYFQRILGLSLVGEVNGDKQIAPVLNGTGANGKTTAIEALSFALGDYAHTAEPALLMAKNFDTHPTGVADLLGRRLVSIAETGQDRRFDVPLLKRLTGGDSLKARFMRQDFFEFKPSHLLVMSTNHLPRIDDDSVAVWRRLRVIPFVVQIPEEERDARLKEKLETEADAVLTWVIAGWADYRDRGGLDTPDAVLVATNQYKAESDAVGRFIDDECHTGGAQSSAATATLYARWETWAAKDGCLPLSRIAFGRALDTKGFPAENTHARLRRRICLREESAGQ